MQRSRQVVQLIPKHAANSKKSKQQPHISPQWSRDSLSGGVVASAICSSTCEGQEWYVRDVLREWAQQGLGLLPCRQRMAGRPGATGGCEVVGASGANLAAATPPRCCCYCCTRCRHHALP